MERKIRETLKDKDADNNKELIKRKGAKEYSINKFQDKIRSKGDLYYVLTTGSK